MDVAIVVDAASLAEPDSLGVLVPALAARGVSAGLVAWDAPGMEWSRVRAAVIRATWDYHLRPDDFHYWVERVATLTALWNPAPVVLWNMRKTYLRDLAARGVAIIPTLWITCGSAVSLAEILARQGWTEVVIKPTVSASAWETLRVGPQTLADGEAHLARMLMTRDVMLQPYQAAVETSGERSLVFIDGEFTHAFRRAAILSAGGGGGHHATESLIAAEPDEVAFARAALDTAGYDVLYARVDVVRGGDGRVLLMELELIEPGLGLASAPWAADRLAGAIARRLR